ncbi:MAG: hypothetical protein MJE77_04590 [Proteobacteria bacterium]|nr:hypothetical protein [Pseudomonadota bacterium]
MPSKSRIQWCGLALAVTGALFFTGIWHPHDSIEGILDARWIPIHILAYIASILVLFGLIGMYAPHADKFGRAGLIGFVMTFISGVAVSGVGLCEVAVLPVLVADPAAQAVGDPQSGALMKGLYGAVLLSGFLIYVIGMFVFCTTALRRRLLPRLGMWALMAGYAMLVGGIFIVRTVDPESNSLFHPAHMIKNSGQITLSFGYVWVGYHIWSGRVEEA